MMTKKLLYEQHFDVSLSPNFLVYDIYRIEELLSRVKRKNA